MRLAALFAIVLTACTSPTPPAPSTPPPIPPPPPARAIRTAVVTGNVRLAGGSTPAGFALVSARVASPDCGTPQGDGVQVFADAHGVYELSIEGPALPACVAVTATRAGATATLELPNVRFESGSTARVQGDIALSPLEPMTRVEAETLIGRFADAINGRDDVVLGTLLPDGPEALRVALEDYRALLGERVNGVLTDWESSSMHQRAVATLRGSNGNALSVSLYQDQRRSREFHGALADFGLRSRHFIASFSRLVSAGDAERLARLLTADDIDYPVERARRVIAKYRPPFDAGGGRFEIVSVDEQRSRMTYKLTWQGEGAREHSTTVTLGYGDGLLWLADEAV